MSSQAAGQPQAAAGGPSRGPGLTFAATRCVGRRRQALRPNFGEDWPERASPPASPGLLRLPSQRTRHAPAPLSACSGWRRCTWFTRRRRTGGSRCASTSCLSPPGRWAHSKRSRSSCSPCSSECSVCCCDGVEVEAECAELVFCCCVCVACMQGPADARLLPPCTVVSNQPTPDLSIHCTTSSCLVCVHHRFLVDSIISSVIWWLEASPGSEQ